LILMEMVLMSPSMPIRNGVSGPCSSRPASRTD
jgi:hypothetical protein